MKAKRRVSEQLGLAQAIELARHCIILGLWASVRPRLLDGEYVVWALRRNTPQEIREPEGWYLVTWQPVDVFRSLSEVEAFIVAAVAAERAAHEQMRLPDSDEAES